jgi:leader peptidase (prepilin peptidase) / N-methyltransferase
MDILFIFMIGSVFGSFFGVLVDRIPERKSIIFGRSHCDSCQQLLSFRDLIPLFSQISSGSCCRYCKNKIPLIYLFLEFSTALIFTLAWLGYLNPSQFLLTILSIILSAFDYRQHCFPFIIWLIFALGFILLLPLSPLFYMWLALALLAEKFNLRIGSGDFLWFFTASFCLTFLDEMLLLQIACSIGIIYYLITKKRAEIAFIPFLTIAYLVLLFGHQIL